MKKIAIALLLIAAGAAAIFVIARSIATKQSPSGAKSEIASLPAKDRWRIARNDGKEKSPTARGELVEPRAVGAPPKIAPAPIQIRFDAPIPPEKDKAVPVTMAVESVPGGWPAEIGEGARLELLLRLPVGVKLKSGGWAPVELAEEEKQDASGPWSLYEKRVPLQIKPGVPPGILLKETVALAVVEEGTNWIITARARLVQGASAWQTFGVLFATLQGTRGEFHASPKGPMDSQSAQTN